MFENTSAAPIFKSVALLLLVVALMTAGALATRFEKVHRFQKWLKQNRNFRKALLWLSFAIVFLAFGVLTIAYEFTH